MNLKKRLKQKKYYTLLISSYVAFILISLCIGIWYYSNIRSSTSEIVLNYNQSMINLMKSNVDRTINEVNFIDHYIQIDSTTKKIISGDMTDKREKYNYMHLLNSLKKDSKLIDDVCVYLENEDIVVSSRGVHTSQMYFDIQCKVSGYTYEEWKDRFLLQPKNRDFYPVESIALSENVIQNVIIYKRSLYAENKKTPNAHILMMLKADEMTKHIEKMRSVIGREGIIIDKLGNVIFATDNSIKKHTFDMAYLNEDNRLNENTGKIEAYEESDNSNLVYVSLFDKDIVFKDVNGFAKIGIISVVMYLLFTIVFLLISSNMVYNPIKSVLKKIGSENNGDSSEIERISTKIDNLLTNEKNYLYQIRELSEHKRKSQLRDLLTKNISNIDTELLKWQDEFFMVMVVQFGLHSKNDDDEVQGVPLIKYAVLNIAEDIFAKLVMTEVIELENNCIAVVFNLKNEDYDIILDKIYEGTRILQDVFELEFYATVSIAVSSCHKGEHNLNLCFNEAMQALDFKVVDFGNELVRYDMINQTNKKGTVCYWPSDLDEMVKGLINNGDYNGIESLIDEIIKTNLETVNVTSSVKDYIYYNLLGVYIRIASKMMNYTMIKNIEYDKKKTWIENIEDIKNEFRQLSSIYKIDSLDNIKLLKKIEQYIDEHFGENSLDLVQIAESNHVSVQYLTSYFKRHKKTTVLKYITRKRVDYSKNLLLDTNLTINEIALKVGYTDASVFTKVFKKTENITPGMYRTLVKNSK